MGFLSKVGGAATTIAGLGIAGYGAYKVGTQNSDQALTTGTVAKDVYDSTGNIYESAGAGLMELYFQDRDYNEGFKRNSGILGLGSVMLAAGVNEFTDINQYLDGRTEPEE